MSLYDSLPLWGQNVAISAYGAYWRWLRFGGHFPAAVEQFTARSTLSWNQWESLQRNQLRQLLATAAERVPYYRETWTNELKVAAMAGHLTTLPLLEKRIVRENPRSFLVSGARIRAPLTFHTSGSTGTPIASFWTVGELRESMAVREARSARWADVSFQRPRATFGGRIVVPHQELDTRDPLHRYNHLERQAYLSSFHLGRRTAPLYVQALRDRRIEWLTGYASCLSLLARFVTEQGLVVPPLKAVITTSETLTDDMRTAIQRAYQCPVFNEYSTVENCFFASECRNHRLHVSPDIGFIEILLPDGSPAPPDHPGEVVATSIMRRTQPLIRYRIGDIAAWDPSPCTCGVNTPILKNLIGRVEDSIVRPDGGLVTRLGGVFAGLSNIIEAQLIQETTAQVEVRVVPTPDFSDSDEREIANRLHQRLGQDVTISVVSVTRIERTASGKFRSVTSQIPPRSENAM